MSFDLQIRERISHYLSGGLKADDLESWLSAIAWEIDDEPRTTRQLAHRALRLVSETANGDLTAAELRVRLSNLIVADPQHSALIGVIIPPASEQLLERLSAAQQSAQDALSVDWMIGVMRYAKVTQTLTQAWSESAPPSGPAFLHRPKAERQTPDPAPKELAIS